MSEQIINSVKQGLKWALVTRLTYQLASWVVTIYVIRLLTPEDFAIVALTDISAGLLMSIGNLGLAGAIVKNQDLNKFQIRQILGTLVTVNLAFFLLITFGAGLIANHYKTDVLQHVLFIYSLLFIIMPYEIVYKALLVKELEFKKVQLIELAGSLSNLLITLVLAIMGFGFWALIFGMMARPVTEIFLLAFQKKSLILPVFKFTGINHVFIDGRDTFVTMIIMEFNNRIDRIMISQMLGKTSLGYHGIANSLAVKPVSLIGSLVQKFSLATFSKINATPEKVSRYMNQSLKLLNFFMIPIFFGIAIVAPTIVPLVMGEKWIGAIVPLQLLSLAQIFNMLRMNIGPALFTLGYGKRRIFHALVGTVIFLVSWTIGLQFGLNEGCLSYLVGYGVWVIWIAYDSKKRINLDFYLFAKHLLIPLTAALLMMAGTLTIRDYFLVDLSLSLQSILQVLTGMSIYVLSLYILFPNYLSDVRMLMLKK